jgi:hypothetical protein
MLCILSAYDSFHIVSNSKKSSYFLVRGFATVRKGCNDLNFWSGAYYFFTYAAGIFFKIFYK